MIAIPACPECKSEYVYADGIFCICPECSYEWNPQSETVGGDELVQDANGNTLANGDTVSLIKDLKVKGSTLVLKVGTKVKNIRLVESDHDIDCKIDGVGAMKLKSMFVKKV